jgi:hypothetical protein
MMDITRNQYFLAGLLLLFLGIQFRLIDSVDLNPEFSQFLAERSNHPVASVGAATQALIQLEKPVIKKNVRPPDWIGWSLASVGAVLILHSLAMKKPGG